MARFDLEVHELVVRKRLVTVEADCADAAAKQVVATKLDESGVNHHHILQVLLLGADYAGSDD